jgi:hypothetical protein
VTASHSRILCFLGAGVGSALRFRITIGGQTSPLAAGNYVAPSITNVTLFNTTTNETLPAGSGAPTTGLGVGVRIVGHNLGSPEALVAAGATLLVESTPAPPSTAPPLSALARASNCSIRANHTLIECTALGAGAGSAHAWRVALGDAVSPWSTSTPGYAPPTVNAAALSATALPVDGTVLTVRGANFGPAGAAVAWWNGVPLGASAVGHIAHDALFIAIPPGGGKNHLLRIGARHPDGGSDGAGGGMQNADDVFLDFATPTLSRIAFVSESTNGSFVARVGGLAFAPCCFCVFSGLANATWQAKGIRDFCAGRDCAGARCDDRFRAEGRDRPWLLEMRNETTRIQVGSIISISDTEIVFDVPERKGDLTLTVGGVASTPLRFDRDDLTSTTPRVIATGIVGVSTTAPPGNPAFPATLLRIYATNILADGFVTLNIGAGEFDCRLSWSSN